MGESNHEDLDFTWNGLTLAGTLHLPNSAGPNPAVLMMQGSGPADRDSDGYFPPIRQAFVARQIATFAFDKPGCGMSTGNWRDDALERRVDQALAALDLLREHPAIASERVGIWGHSQGGWLVQLLASRLPDLPFAITNSGPSINVPQQDLYGCEHTMRSKGHPERDIKRALALLTDLHQAAENGTDYATVTERILEEVIDKPWYGYLTIDNAEDWCLVKLMIGERYEPRDALARIVCPFLAIYGGLDLLVPAWQGAEESGRALQAAGNTDATVTVFPGGDHRIRDPATGDFVTGYLDQLGDWTARQVGRAAR